MAFTDYPRYDGLGLARLVRDRQVSPLEVLEAAIERIERHDRRVNAVVHKMYDRARAAAAQQASAGGPFAGVPFLQKDLIQAVSGEPLTSGSRMTQAYRPGYDGELTRRYRKAGLVLLGKTNTPEFGLVPYTEPRLFGPARNPWDTGRTTGGSSGGSAAAVAARYVPIGHGGDGGGSIRIPASCCGVFGLKPTRARTPSGPDHAVSWQGCAVEHVLTRSVRDSAAALDATAGPDVGAPYYPPAPERPYLEEVGREPGKLRIALTTTPFLAKSVDPACVRAAEDAARLCRDLGHTVEEASPTIDREALSLAILTMLAGETAADVEHVSALAGRRPTPDLFEEATWALYMAGQAVSALDYANAVRSLHLLGRSVGPFFDRYDVLLTPTLGMVPFPVGALQPKPVERALMRAFRYVPSKSLMRAVLPKLAEDAFTFIPFTMVFNVTGQPAMSVPLASSSDGLPIGVQFVGRYADEATLFRLAGQLERARPWADKTPPGFE